LPDVAAAAGLCDACSADPPLVERVRSALAYDGASRRLILAFKHGGRLDGVGLFAGWLSRAGREILAEADLLVPVPLHRWRLLGRGFNQAALLAGGVSRLTGIPWTPSALRRHRATASQQGLGAAERRRNITAAAFSLVPRMTGRVVDKRIVLVDDVLTTGATLDACALTLREAGAARIDALTLARVVKPEHDPI
jgi:ComF family protein